MAGYNPYAFPPGMLPFVSQLGGLPLFQHPQPVPGQNVLLYRAEPPLMQLPIQPPQLPPSPVYAGREFQGYREVEDTTGETSSSSNDTEMAEGDIAMPGLDASAPLLMPGETEQVVTDQDYAAFLRRTSVLAPARLNTAPIHPIRVPVQEGGPAADPMSPDSSIGSGRSAGSWQIRVLRTWGLNHDSNRVNQLREAYSFRLPTTDFHIEMRIRTGHPERTQFDRLSRFFTQANLTTPDLRTRQVIEIAHLAMNTQLFISPAGFAFGNPHVVAPVKRQYFKEVSTWGEARLLFSRIVGGNLWANVCGALTQALSAPDLARVNQATPPGNEMLFSAQSNPGSLAIGVRAGFCVADNRPFTKLYLHYL